MTCLVRSLPTIRLRGALWLLIFLAFPTFAEQEKPVTVTIEGVSGQLLENVRAYLSLQDETFLESVRATVGLEEEKPRLAEAHVRRLYRKAPTEIRQALRALGYYHPKIASRLSQTKAGWTATFSIQPGPPMRVIAVDLRIDGAGESDPAFQRFIRDFPLKKGDILNHGTWEKAKSDLQSLASERGYFDAKLTVQRFTVDLDQNTARLTLHFATGPRYRFGPVRFQQDVLDERLLKRFVPFKLGDPFLSSKLIELQNALVGSGYFSTSDVRRLQDQAVDDKVPIEVILTPEKKYRFSVAAGFGTDTGPRGSLTWQVRRINRFGHQFSTLLEGSLLGGRFKASYDIPLENPVTERLSIEAQASREITDTRESNIFTLGGRRTDELGAGWLQTLFLDFEQEFFQVGQQEGESRLVLPGSIWKRVRADDLLRTRRGSRLLAKLQGTGTFLGSDVSFLQALGQDKLIRSLGNRQRVLFRADLGGTLVEDVTDLPASVRFFAGGSESVRGFAFESLGPRDSTGAVIGGRFLAAASAEYEYRLLKDWGVAAFYDAGNAFNRFGDLELAQGAGIGVRWFSPVGPIRVDFAFAVSEPGAPFRLDIRMGPDL